MSVELPIVIERRVEAPHFDFLALPATPGVLVVEAPGGETLFLGVTADLRHAARGRLDDGHGESGLSRAVDLRPVAHRILAATVGFAFEGELLYAKLAAERRPADHKAAIERWQGWFLHIDPAAEVPRWSKVCLPGWSGDSGPENNRDRAAAGGAVIGPFRDKHQAGRFCELLDDLFDLCRYPNILAQAPRGQACAYKEMGKCPAPCDGSEAMDSYRARVEAAVRSVGRAVRAELDDAAARMEAAARALDFEAAAHAKAVVDRLKAIDTAAFRHARTFDAFRWLVIGRSERRGWSRIIHVDGGRACPVADVNCAQADAALSDLWGRFEVGIPPALPAGAPEQEIVGMVCGRLFAPASTPGRQERFVRLGEAGSRQEAELAVRCVWKPRSKADAPFDDAGMEFEPGSLAEPPPK